MDGAPESAQPGPGVGAGVVLAFFAWIVPLALPPVTIWTIFDGGLGLAASYSIFLTVVTVWTVLWSCGRPWAWLCGAPAAGLLVPSIASTLWWVVGRRDHPIWPDMDEPFSWMLTHMILGLTAITIFAFVWWGCFFDWKAPASPSSATSRPLQGARGVRCLGVLTVGIAWVMFGGLVWAGRDTSDWGAPVGLVTVLVAMCAVSGLVWALRRVVTVLEATRSSVDTLVAMLLGGTGILWLYAAFLLIATGYPS